MDRISDHEGVVDEVLTGWGGAAAATVTALARRDETVKGLGAVTTLASCAWATTGTGPMNSDTWNSKASVCRTQARRRVKKAEWGPSAGRRGGFVSMKQILFSGGRFGPSRVGGRSGQNVPKKPEPNMLILVWMVAFLPSEFLVAQARSRG